VALPPLRVSPSRVLRTEEAATTDAQRQQFVSTTRANATTEALNTIRATPFGTDGQMLTQPNGTGGRTEALTLTAGDNVIGHTLGRPALGFVVADLQATSAIAAAGAWHDMTRQVATAINTAQLATCNVVEYEDGIAQTSPTRFEVTRAGLYDVQFSAQLDSNKGSDSQIWIWLVKNGTAVAESASVIRVKGNDGETVAAWNWFIELAAGDAVSIGWAVDSLQTYFETFAASAFAPAIPSFILTIDAVASPLALTRVERSRLVDDRSILIRASADCTAKIWVW
jgi:hypothetical protein